MLFVCFFVCLLSLLCVDTLYVRVRIYRIKYVRHIYCQQVDNVSITSETFRMQKIPSVHDS